MKLLSMVIKKTLKKKKKFEKFKCKSNSDICRIQKKINEILEYDEWPLDVLYQ